MHRRESKVLCAEGTDLGCTVSNGSIVAGSGVLVLVSCRRTRM